MKSGQRKKHRLRKGLLIVFVVLLLLFAAELLYSNYAIKISRYTVSSEKVSGSFRILFLSDLHGRSFGKNNRRLLSKIEAEKPDLICMVGDIVNRDADDEEVSAMCELIHAAAQIAPVYFSLGNHEASYIKANGTALADRLTAAGAIVLDNRYLDLSIRSTDVRIGGYSGCYRIPHMDTGDPEEQTRLTAFADDFEDTDRFKLLLNHIPLIWLDWDYRDRFPVDLVLSGHYHGGIVRIPILEQGLYAPYVGKLPPYTKGMFEGKKATCILTTGMAGQSGIPRFFNPPEIVVVSVEG